MIKIFLAENHTLVRKALVALLHSQFGFLVIGEAADGLTTVSNVRELKPDILLLDLSLPIIHGLKVVWQVRQATKVKVLILTMHSGQCYVSESFRAGASGYLLKDSTVEEMVQGIRTVAGGGTYLCSSLEKQVLDRSILHHSKPEDALAKLTSRERSVLELAAEGHTNPEIGRILSITARTVETHRSNLLKKLSLKSQTDLVRFAIRKQLIAA